MKTTVLLVAVLCMAGCATIGNESLTTRSDQWPPLIMTEAELITDLGPPNLRMTTAKDGQTVRVLSWTYARAEINPALFVPVLGLFVAASGEGVDTQHRRLSVSFDTHGIMLSRAWIEGRTGNTATLD